MKFTAPFPHTEKETIVSLLASIQQGYFYGSSREVPKHRAAGKVLLKHWLGAWYGASWVAAVRVLKAVALSSSLENVSVLTIMAKPEERS